MEDLFKKVDEFYEQSTSKLKDYTNPENSSASSLIDASNILMEAVTSFGEKSNDLVNSIGTDHPDLKDDLKKYIIEKHNELVTTYKAK